MSSLVIQAAEGEFPRRLQALSALSLSTHIRFGSAAPSASPPRTGRHASPREARPAATATEAERELTDTLAKMTIGGGDSPSTKPKSRKELRCV